MDAQESEAATFHIVHFLTLSKHRNSPAENDVHVNGILVAVRRCSVDTLREKAIEFGVSEEVV
jgi:hypothetical protein